MATPKRRGTVILYLPRPSLPHISRRYTERGGRFVSCMKLRQPARSLMMARLLDTSAAH
ncbi:MAG TPA: hypothetical protein VK548_22435 [Candidatus Acidoferrum sp.]|nr:hypothetical protein [Candidatus Acidoferrum sp.]